MREYREDLKERREHTPDFLEGRQSLIQTAVQARCEEREPREGGGGARGKEGLGEARERENRLLVTCEIRERENCGEERYAKVGATTNFMKC